MPELVVRLKKHSDGAAILSCVRSDRSATWQQKVRARASSPSTISLITQWRQCPDIVEASTAWWLQVGTWMTSARPGPAVRFR